MQNENTNLTAVLERAGLAVKLSIISCVLSAVLSIIILLTGPVYEWAGFATFTLSLIPFTIAFLCALMAWIHSKLTEKAIRDEEEKVILQKRKESKLSILEISEDVRFTAGRNLLNFEKYVPSTVAALMTVILAFVLVYLWKALISVRKTPSHWQQECRNSRSCWRSSVRCAPHSACSSESFLPDSLTYWNSAGSVRSAHG